MAIEWGILKGQLVEAVLKDKNGTKYTSDQLNAWARWALHELSFHTAEAASVTYLCDGVMYQFDLPDDMVDDLEHTGLVGLDTGDQVDYLPPLRVRPNQIWLPSQPTLVTSLSGGSSSLKSNKQSLGFQEWPANTLTLSFIPPKDATVILHYFKVWEGPVQDTDMIMVPAWLERPFLYMLAACAMDPLAVQASDIRQWLDKSSAGMPEQNPLQRQYEFFIRNAERLLSKHRAQDRESFFSAFRPRDSV